MEETLIPFVDANLGLGADYGFSSIDKMAIWNQVDLWCFVQWMLIWLIIILIEKGGKSAILTLSSNKADANLVNLNRPYIDYGKSRKKCHSYSHPRLGLTLELIFPL